ncbi:amidohydrolase [Bosea sp. BIWAKO-01]|uniref:amidohydrolase n=1 Tax=Bosea sp. BIWAKO-01 TaxID=506668 RepID=UPI000853B5F5|nr:amidohydrolase [Bosea sp. BIWAKO-01]GAU81860.1 hydrolase [Bosea sp. BIWAKO-01]
MFLTNSDMVELVAWRQQLHRSPEISGEEQETAKAVVAFLAPSEPDRIVTGLGGHGVAAIYEGREPGPTVMVRCELDALPIEEISESPHRSQVPGKSHACGHDGHMTMVAALSRGLGRQRPQRGRAVLLFQPAEENGAGAAAVIADPKFAEIAPDYAFSLHNKPGLPLGYITLSEGPANCASRGLQIVLTGKTSHASMPEHGISPVAAVARLMPALTALGPGGPLDAAYALVTVTHAAIGEAAFGIAPGRAEIWATLRTLNDAQMGALCTRAEALVRETAEASGLGVELSYHDVFHHCENDAEAVALLRKAFDDEKLRHGEGSPSRGSEDFGLFGRQAKSAMFILGSGETSPQLHNPDFDFPDALIEPGSRAFMRTLRNLLG